LQNKYIKNTEYFPNLYITQHRLSWEFWICTIRKRGKCFGRFIEKWCT